MPSDPPKVIQVPVKRHDVNLSLQDILAPLIQFANQSRVAQAVAAAPEVQQHAQQLGDLARQLHDLVGRLNDIDPKLLAPGPQTNTPDDTSGTAGR